MRQIRYPPVSLPMPPIMFTKHSSSDLISEKYSSWLYFGGTQAALQKAWDRRYRGRGWSGMRVCSAVVEVVTALPCTENRPTFTLR